MTTMLEAIDMFNTKFCFTIDRKKGYSTAFGGLLTIITAIVFVILFCILGKDFIFRDNPMTSSSSILNGNSFERVNLSAYNLTIAISLHKNRIADSNIDLNGDFFWSDTAFHRKYFNQTKNQTVLISDYSPLKKCSDLSYTTSKVFPPNYYCIEFPSNLSIGEDKRLNETYSITYAIYNCEKKFPVGVGAKCNNLTTLQNIFKVDNTLDYMLSIYYPVLYYDPRDKIAPAKINYEEMAFPFDYNLQRTDILSFQKSTINEDKGWWFEDNHNETFWTVESREYYTQYKSDTELALPVSSSKFYALNIVISIKNDYYTRSYMKLPSLIAIVAAFLKIIVILMEAFVKLINSSLMEYAIFNLLFDTSPPKYAKNNNISIYGQGNNSNLANPNNSDINLLNITKNKTVNIFPINNKNNLTRTTLNKKKRSNINSCFALRNIFGKALFRESEKELLNQYKQGTKIVKEKVDIENYLKLVYDMIILQKSVYNEAQYYSLNFLKKVNLYDNKEIKNFFPQKNVIKEELLNKYAGYYINGTDRNTLDQKDKLLYDRMTDKFKAMLINKKILLEQK